MKYWLKIRSPMDIAPGQMVADLQAAKTHMAQHQILVLESGLGIGGAYWLVVSDPAPTIKLLRGKLGELDQYIEHVEPVQHPAEGFTLARQVPLFH
jgi:hypothetical protein